MRQLSLMKKKKGKEIDGEEVPPSANVFGHLMTIIKHVFDEKIEKIYEP